MIKRETLPRFTVKPQPFTKALNKAPFVAQLDAIFVTPWVVTSKSRVLTTCEFNAIFSPRYRRSFGPVWKLDTTLSQHKLDWLTRQISRLRRQLRKGDWEVLPHSPLNWGALPPNMFPAKKRLLRYLKSVLSSKLILLNNSLDCEQAFWGT